MNNKELIPRVDNWYIFIKDSDDEAGEEKQTKFVPGFPSLCKAGGLRALTPMPPTRQRALNQ